MIEEPALLRIKSRSNRPTKAQIAAFKDVPSSFVSDALGGTGAMHPAIKPIDPRSTVPSHVAGPALTIECPPADNLGVLAALSRVEDGDIMVVATSGFINRAVIGDMVIGMFKNQGGAGFVTDGALRDLIGLRKMGLGCWGAGLTPASPYTTGPGAVGHSILIADQTVHDGDMIVADEDGVVVVPFADIPVVIERLEAIKTMEATRDAEVANGLSIPARITDLLATDQVEFDD
jgi:4-hydroxy-4-methyl-2-oxoglutarate aldolase